MSVSCEVIPGRHAEARSAKACEPGIQTAAQLVEKVNGFRARSLRSRPGVT
jgi:hypothetical protein